VNELTAEIVSQIDVLLAAPTFGLDPHEHQARLLAVLRDELHYACTRDTRIQRYVHSWPIDYRCAKRVADLPYLPVTSFKTDPPLALVGTEKIVRTLSSSATTGQTPSRVALDAETSMRMVKGVASILRSFIGPTRRPYLVIDAPETLAARTEIGARGAAIQALRPFASEIVCCLRVGVTGDLELEEQVLNESASRWRGQEVLIYGFTYVVWKHLVTPLLAKGVTLRMPMIRLLHSGGWKRLQDEAVTRDTFNAGVAELFGCREEHVIDFYGMVENVGIIYPDCEYGNKHVPAFGDVIIRDPLTLLPVAEGQEGLVQVCSVLPTSFPGFLVLTDDIARVVCYDGCPCGRRGTCFRFVKRVPKAEVRGCGNIETTRQRLVAAL